MSFADYVGAVDEVSGELLVELYFLIATSVRLIVEC